MPREEKSKTIDDILNSIHAQPTHDIAKNLEAYDAHHKPENQQKLFNELFAPAIDEFYNALKVQLDAAFKGAGGDTAKVKEKMPEVRKALVESLKKFFAKAMPSALEAIEGITDAEQQYRVLAHFYDTQVLGAETQQDAQRLAQAGTITLQQYVAAIEQGDLSVGQIKEGLYMQKAQHARQARTGLNEKAELHYIAGIPAHRLARHLKPEIEKTHTIDDIAGYVTMGHEGLMEIRNALKTGQWPQQRAGPAHYGLKAKEAQQQRQ
ncbi:hypothetical protein HYY73_02315 [Candidatus Woesearchaeota archaeon]|nr:hypothetical protein [Candidatus Woesearchaeota archaeon]